MKKIIGMREDDSAMDNACNANALMLLETSLLSWRKLDTEDGFCIVIAKQHPWFVDHRLKACGVLPGVVSLELVFIAAQRLYPDLSIMGAHDVVWKKPIIADQHGATLRLILKVQPTYGLEFALYHNDQCCCHGYLSATLQPLSPVVPLSCKTQICCQDYQMISHAALYQAFVRMGIDYGPWFRCIDYACRYHQHCFAQLSAKNTEVLAWSSLLDCSFQAGMAISIGEHQDSLMPYSLGQLVFHRQFNTQKLAKAFALTEKSSSFRTQISIYDETDNPIISVFDLGVKASQ